jgi:energy-converting hydrogenase Eha subunit A
MTRHAVWFVLFAIVATVCSLPRFGQRENEHAPTVSDSDYYLEMSRVFAGEQAQFTPAYVAAGPHHYNRPLLPWAAGMLGKYLLGGDMRAAFSLLAIFASAMIALILKLAIERQRPSWRFTWLPSVLFLTGFPQLNWGYHLLTDTMGLATAMAAALYAVWLVTSEQSELAFARHVLGVFACSAVAFLTRETGWLAVITASWVSAAMLAKASNTKRVHIAVVLLALLAGKLPHSIYENAHSLHTPPLHMETVFSWNPNYWLDVVVKSAVCFHVVWLLVGWRLWEGVRSRSLRMPPLWLLGWTLGAVLYMAAAFAHNDITRIGYPMRIIYSLFPLVYFWVEELFESNAIRWRPQLLAVLLCVLQLGVGLTGVRLDPGTPNVTAPGLLQEGLP